MRPGLGRPPYTLLTVGTRYTLCTVLYVPGVTYTYWVFLPPIRFTALTKS